MTTTTTKTTKAAGKGRTRTSLSPAKREQLDTERRVEVEGLLGQITEAVTQLHTEPGWLALLSAAARLHSYRSGSIGMFESLECSSEGACPAKRF